jgi:hypothetical protein
MADHVLESAKTDGFALTLNRPTRARARGAGGSQTPAWSGAMPIGGARSTPRVRPSPIPMTTAAGRSPRSRAIPRSRSASSARARHRSAQLALARSTREDRPSQQNGASNRPRIASLASSLCWASNQINRFVRISRDQPDRWEPCSSHVSTASPGRETSAPRTLSWCVYVPLIQPRGVRWYSRVQSSYE